LFAHGFIDVFDTARGAYPLAVIQALGYETLILLEDMAALQYTTVVTLIAQRKPTMNRMRGLIMTPIGLDGHHQAL
jgi:hypothetical protein